MNLIKQHCFLQWEAHYIFLQVSLAETQATSISCESKAHTHIIALNKFNLQRMMPLFGDSPMLHYHCCRCTKSSKLFRDSLGLNTKNTLTILKLGLHEPLLNLCCCISLEWTIDLWKNTRQKLIVQCRHS